MPMPQIELRQGSLTDGDELILVNASNTNANLGTGVSAAIRAACGPGYQAAIHEALQEARGGPMEPGDAFVTNAGTHPHARWVVHAAVMDYRDGFSAASAPDEGRIRSCYENSWRRIEDIDHPELSVALPALGAGTGQLGVRIPTRLACETLESHLAGRAHSRIARVVFYGYAIHEFAAICDVVRQELDLPPEAIPEEVRSFLDATDSTVD